jgi:hypothetical protein
VEDSIIDNNSIYIAGSVDNSSSSKREYKVGKYNLTNKDMEWKRTFNGTDMFNKAYGIAQSDESIYTTGRVDYNNEQNWRAVKYDKSNGKRQWVKKYNSDNGSYPSDRAYTISVGPAENVYVGGYMDNGQDDDWRVVRYTSTGEKKWVKTYDSGNGNDIINSITVDENGRLYVAGSYASNGGFDWRVAKYNE